MKRAIHLEYRASSSWSKHEGESSLGLCDRLDRTRDNSQRQLPTDHDYAVPTREYQTDQSSLKPAQAAARSVLGKKQRQLQKQPHRSRGVDTVTPYQLTRSLHIRPNRSPSGRATERRVSLRLGDDALARAISVQPNPSRWIKPSILGTSLNSRWCQTAESQLQPLRTAIRGKCLGTFHREPSGLRSNWRAPEC